MDLAVGFTLYRAVFSPPMFHGSVGWGVLSHRGTPLDGLFQEKIPLERMMTRGPPWRWKPIFFWGQNSHFSCVNDACRHHCGQAHGALVKHSSINSEMWLTYTNIASWIICQKKLIHQWASYGPTAPSSPSFAMSVIPRAKLLKPPEPPLIVDRFLYGLSSPMNYS